MAKLEADKRKFQEMKEKALLDVEKKRLKQVFVDEDSIMQSAIRYEQRADHSTLTDELRGDSIQAK